MFCPQCSQQQVSDEVRFCPRCGFPLDGVAMLLASGGVTPAARPGGGEWEYGPPSPRLKGVRQGVMLWLLGVLLVPLLILMTEELDILPEMVAIFVAMLLFMGGLVRMAYAMLLEDGPLRRRKLPVGGQRPAAGAQLSEAWAQQQRGQSALPPGQSVPASAYVPPRADTSEIAQRPPSVTEGTTRLLDE